MKYYFDVVETFIKTVAIEADNLEQAQKRLMNAYCENEFEVEHNYCDDVDFKEIKEEDLLETENIETFNCNELVYDEGDDVFLCPVCRNFIAAGDAKKCIDIPIPSYCSKCGTKLHLR